MFVCVCVCVACLCLRARAQAAYASKLKDVMARHLAATLRLLEPANEVALWPVTIVTKKT